jgi:hypothetical protein
LITYVSHTIEERQKELRHEKNENSEDIIVDVVLGCDDAYAFAVGVVSMVSGVRGGMYVHEKNLGVLIR